MFRSIFFHTIRPASMLFSTTQSFNHFSVIFRISLGTLIQYHLVVYFVSSGSKVINWMHVSAGSCSVGPRFSSVSAKNLLSQKCQKCYFDFSIPGVQGPKTPAVRSESTELLFLQTSRDLWSTRQDGDCSRDVKGCWHSCLVLRVLQTSRSIPQCVYAETT